MLDERIISGKGVLKIPPAALKYRYYILYMDVIRRPKNEYSNYTWNPTKSFYANLAFRRDEYVQFDQQLHYTRQCFTYVNDIAGEALIAIKCAYAGILQSFVNLVTGLGGTPGGIGIYVSGVENQIEDYKSLALGWDEILFNCYSSTALQVRIYGLKYDSCDPEKDDPYYPPPPPPPLPEVPPDTPIGDISPPYDPDTNDDGNTDPFPDDSIPVPPDLPGEVCTLYHLVIRIFSDGYGEPTPGYFDYEYFPYGEVFIELRDEPTPNRAYIISRSGYPLGCSETPTEDLIINLGSYTISSYEILVFEEYTPP